MQLPGFTADTTLSRNIMQNVLIHNFRPTDGWVRPALICDIDYQDCIDGCNGPPFLTKEERRDCLRHCRDNFCHPRALRALYVYAALHSRLPKEL